MTLADSPMTRGLLRVLLLVVGLVSWVLIALMAYARLRHSLHG